MTKAYSYSRFSHPSQRVGDSLRRQLKGCFEWAAKHDLELDTTHHDPGLSGFTGMNRIKGALGSFIAKVEAGEIEPGSFLLVDSMDRLSRENETRVLNMLTNLTLAGIKVVNVVEDHVLDENATMVDYMRVLINATRSRQESVEKGRKVAEAHGDRKRRAREETVAWHSTGPHWLKGTPHGKGKDRFVTFEPIDDKVRIVRRVFDLIESGLGTTAIAIRFNDDKEPTPRDGKGWHHSTVLEIAKNRAVLGEYQPKLSKNGNRASRRPADGDAVPRYFGEGVISPEQFYRVQEIIKSRGSQTGRKANLRKFTNLFIGIGKCSECSGKIGIHVASQVNGWKRTAVLNCVNSRRGLCDNKHRYPYDDLEVAILDNVSEFEPPRPTKRMGRVNEAIEKAMTHRADVAHRLENVKKLAEASGDLDFIARKNELDDELKAVDRKISDLRDEQRQQGATQPFGDRQKALQALAVQMATLEGEELYRQRAAVSVAVRGLVEWMDFDPNGDVRVILSGATVAYRFQMSVNRWQKIELPAEYPPVMVPFVNDTNHPDRGPRMPKGPKMWPNARVSTTA